MAELYDVVFYGADDQADSVDETREKVARLLKVNGSKLEALFEKKGGTTLRKGVSLTVAKKYQQALVNAGGRCRFQEAKQKSVTSKNEVVTTEFVCSECDYRQMLEENEPEPPVCPACDAGEEELEQDERVYVITDDGVTQMDVSQVSPVQQVKTDEAKKNKDTNSDHSRLSAKHVCFAVIAGVVIGAMSVFAYNYYYASKVSAELMAQNNAEKLAAATNALEQRNAANELPTLQPGQQAMMDINQLALSIVDGSTDVNAEAAFLPDYLSDVAHEAVSGVNNPEQDLSMIVLIERLIAADKLSQAYQVSHSINNPTWRFNSAGKIAAAFAASSNIDASGMISTTLRTETNKISKVHERIDKLSKLALFKADAEDLTGAQMLLQNAESLTKNMSSSAMKALSLGYIAAIQAKIGLQITSENNFSLANQALTSSTNTQARLYAFVELARAYAEAGNKSIAFAILHEVLQACKQISNHTQRGVLLGQVAYGLSVVGDSQAAFDAIGLIEPVSLRDENLYRIIIEQIHAKRLYQAMATAEQFNTAVYQAKGHALLARFFVGSSMDLLVADRFELATQVSSYIADRVSQAVVMSEIARYQARVGNNEKSTQLFAASFTLAQQIDNSLERDDAFAQISRNQALVSHIPQAVQTARQIIDEGLQDLVLGEINSMKKTHRILESFESSMD